MLYENGWFRANRATKSSFSAVIKTLAILDQVNACCLVTGACDPQHHSVLPWRFDIPKRSTFIILEYPSPCKPQRRRQLPTLLFIIQPEPNKVALAFAAVFECLSPMQYSHIIEESHIALFHYRPDFVLLGYKMQRVERFRLTFGQAWDPLRSRVTRSVPHK